MVELESEFYLTKQQPEESLVDSSNRGASFGGARQQMTTLPFRERLIAMTLA